MRSIVIHFLQFEVLNMHPMIYWVMALIYFMVLVSALLSLRSLAMPLGTKLSWFLVILVIPILGLAIYALRCLFKGNWSAFRFLFQSRKLSREIATSRVQDDLAAKL